jgi:integrase
MKGHVAKKGRSYYAVVDQGRDPETGKRRQKWHRAGTTKAEAEKELRRIVTTLDNGTYVAPKSASVADFLQNEWLPSLASRLRPSTIALHTINAETYLIPSVGYLKLQALSPAHLNKLYGALGETGRKDGSGLGPAAVKNVHKTIRRALADALKWGLVARNVADLAEPPRQIAPQIETWTSDDLRTFLEGASEDRHYAAWLLAASTGMRRGEILGLKWSDVDLTRGRLTIRRALVLAKNIPTWSEPKTPRSRRSVPLTQDVTAALKTHKAAQAQERLKAGAAYDDQGLVFCNEDGTLLRPDTFRKRFRKLVVDAGVPPLKLHGLRHTWATIALQVGIHPKVVSEILGHSSISITLDTYSHVIPALEEDAAERVSALFSPR